MLEKIIKNVIIVWGFKEIIYEKIRGNVNNNLSTALPRERRVS